MSRDAVARRVLVGEMTGVFGVRGWLKMRSYTEPASGILNYLPWLVDLRGVEHQLESATGKMHGRGLLIKLPGIDDRDAAASWVGGEIFVGRDRFPELPRGEFYWTDLEGLQVRNLEGVALGAVSHLFATAGNAVVVVNGDRERLIPFLQPEVVRVIDPDAREMVVDWDPDF